MPNIDDILRAHGIGSATQLGGQPATNYLRTDANAPNPQTVANGVKIPVLRNGNARANLLFNSTANLGLTGWQNLANWTASSFNGVNNNSYFQYTGTTASNNQSLLEIPTFAGIAFTISGWVYNSGAAGANGLVLVAFNGSTAISNFASVTIPAGQGWTYIEATGTTPANTTVIYAQMYVPNPATSGTNIAFSRIKVEQGDTATPYSMEGDYNQQQYGTLPLAGLTGQALAGSVGVAAVVAQAQGVHVTATTQQTILSFTPSVTGLYEVKGYVNLNNGTNGNDVKIQIEWTDAAVSTAEYLYPQGINGNAPLQFTGATSIPNSPYALESVTIYALAGDAISVSYTDPTNTPNDYVSAVITRLA